MIFLNDSYIKEFQASVKLVEEDKVVTTDSCFYAQSGGQPGDKGTIEINGQKFNVINTIKHELGIAHVCDQPLKITSEEVKGIIDWEHRFSKLYAHLLDGLNASDVSQQSVLDYLNKD